MRFTNKTRSLASKLTAFPKVKKFWLAVHFPKHADQAYALGFTQPATPGERMLPSGSYGPASRRNADGDVIVHKDQPMETAYRQVEWHWKEFRGRYETVDKHEIRDVPYQRYPRTEVPPFAVELFVTGGGNEALIVAGPFTREADDEATNSLNMFIELFAECEVRDADFSPVAKMATKQLNWTLLPPGRNPWATAKPAIERIVNAADKGNQPVIKARFEEIGRHSPDFLAIGLHGFDGYVAFGFPALGLCLLESRFTNNATYALPLKAWEDVSQLSKAEILNSGLHRARLIHRRGWEDQLAELLREKKRAA